MKKILVAGAGHGGLVAAILLARKGYEVCVVEEKKRKDLGWDWHDMMVLSVFDEAGIERLSTEYVLPAVPMTYYTPNKIGKIATAVTDNPNMVYIDRKGLYIHLIAQAEQSGVKLVFETKVISAVAENSKITGLVVEKRGKKSVMCADLVIDAAGIDSPVRKSLPGFCGIQNIIPDRQTFFVYRAYFERPHGLDDKAPYALYLFHCGNKGMDWVIKDEHFIDVLIGSFGKIDNTIIENAMRDFKFSYKLKDKKLIRGGIVAKIPLRNTLSKFVCDGYAAVGDSACMTEPMSGSGITLSMKAGKILADVIIDADEDEYTTENLWAYQYNYLKNIGMGYMGDENLRNMLMQLSPNDLDYFVCNGVIGATELSTGGVKIDNLKAALEKGVKFAPKIAVLPAIVKMTANNSTAEKAKKLLPEKYDLLSFTKWQQVYDSVSL